ncbi:hypothetical protein [Pseudomonas fluorescens]|uniref:Uncharacterized protein n=1 Tax=Pseudomonas fluorescens TaxID=294 RepID=A0A5E7B688_PSEFL|nr:hypothetical protein [Pseudomonas fluorescens]VVN84274.1 hypothetical protein PS704_01346 [Pseudomonas fluorescens]
MQVQWWLTIVVSLLSLVSGGFWIRSATARVLHDDEKTDDVGMKPFAIVDNEGGDALDVLETAKLQSKWNRLAAWFAGGAAIAQAISSFFFSLP